jgi:hypothetical protein
LILVLLLPFIGALCLGTIRDADRAPKDKLVGFIVEYEELKELVLEALNDADAAHQQGYRSAPDARLNLLKQARDFNQRISEYDDERRIESFRRWSEPEDFHTIFALLTASRALQDSLHVRLGYQLDTKLPSTRAVRAQYESVLRFADEQLHPLARHDN